MQPPTQETGEGDTIAMTAPDETGHIFQHHPCQSCEPGIPVSDGGHETVRIASKKTRMPAMLG